MLAWPAFVELWDCGARDPKHRVHVDREDAFPIRGVGLLQRAALHEIAGVVHQHVEAAEKLRGLGDERGGFRFAREIGFDNLRPATELRGAGFQFVRAGFAGEIMDGHVRAGFEEMAHDRFAESLPPAGDEGAFAVQSSHCQSLVWSGWAAAPFQCSSAPTIKIIPAHASIATRPRGGLDQDQQSHKAAVNQTQQTQQPVLLRVVGFADLAVEIHRSLHLPEESLDTFLLGRAAAAVKPATAEKPRRADYGVEQHTR